MRRRLGRLHSDDLGQETTTLRAVNPRRWIKRTNYRDLDFAPSLAAFTSQRDELLTVLGRLEDAQWALSITVTGAGAPLERTVLSYANRLARHEAAHLGQIERIAHSLRA